MWVINLEGMKSVSCTLSVELEIIGQIIAIDCIALLLVSTVATLIGII